MAQYLDSGSRDPDKSLASWLAREAVDAVDVRVQAGFFSATALADAAPIFERARLMSGALRLVIGSNDGTTSRAALEGLLLVSAPERDERQIAVVRFANRDYFHPKTYHLRRSDGSSTAYVGSANFTDRGLRRHIEAGLVLDSRLGDDTAPLDAIADATDAWFAGTRPGVVLINATTDFDDLVTRQVIGVPQPSPMSSPGPTVTLPSLVSLVPRPASPTTVQMSWTKQLSDGDARRKPGGASSHDRGAIILGTNQGGFTASVGLHSIDHMWFRSQFFDGAPWIQQPTRTGEPKEIAVVPMRVSILGTNLGVRDFEVSDAPNRRQGFRRVPTTHLHTAPIAPEFASQDLRGRTLTMSRYSDGTYSIDIA